MSGTANCAIKANRDFLNNKNKTNNKQNKEKKNQTEIQKKIPK